jgi:hypothetical protein
LHLLAILHGKAARSQELVSKKAGASYNATQRSSHASSRKLRSVLLRCNAVAGEALCLGAVIWSPNPMLEFLCEALMKLSLLLRKEETHALCTWCLVHLMMATHNNNTLSICTAIVSPAHFGFTKQAQWCSMLHTSQSLMERAGPTAATEVTTAQGAAVPLKIQATSFYLPC